MSPRAEFLLVVLGAFGYFILGSIFAFASPGTTPTITDGHLAFLVIFELLVLLVANSFLTIRGRPLHRLGLRPTLLGTIEGLGLASASYAGYVAVFSIATLASLPGDDLLASAPQVTPGLSIALILAVCVVNPLFEELLVCGYIVTSIRERGDVWTAVNISVAVRLSYHLYQGAIGILSIIPLGLCFAYWFSRTGRIWPVIVAHAIFDFAGLYFGSQH